MKLNPDTELSESQQESKQDLEKNHINNKSKVVALVIIVISALFIFISLLVNSMNNNNNNNSNKIKVTLNDKEMAYVNGEIITYDEYVTYLKRGIAYYEEAAGEDIWLVNSNNINMFEILKKRILDELIEVKVQVLNARELNLVNAENILSQEDIVRTLRSYIDNQYVINEEDFRNYANNNDISKNEIDNERKAYEDMVKEKIYNEYLTKLINESKNFIIINNQLYNSIVKEKYIN